MSLLQAVGNDNGAGNTSFTVTLAAATAGSLIGIALYFLGAPTVTISDDKGQTYTKLTAVTISGGGAQALFAYFPNTASGASVITIAFSVSTAAIAIGFEESGVVTASPVDQSTGVAVAA